MDAAAARMDEAEKRISDIEDKLIENSEAENFPSETVSLLQVPEALPEKK